MSKRICFVVSSLHSGGAERVVSELANAWADEGNSQIAILTLASAEEDFFRLNPQIERISLGGGSKLGGGLKGIQNNLRYIQFLRDRFKAWKPDVIFAFGDRLNSLSVLATRGLGIKVFVSERTVPSVHNIGKFSNWLREKTYPMASGVIAQTEPVKKEIACYVPENKIQIIPNPLSVQDFGSGGERNSEIVAIGRFTHEKGFDLLLKAFVLVHAEFPQQKLAIYGDGPLKSELVDLTEKLKIQNQVEFRGQTKSTAQVLSQAQIFVLPSRFEGFPNIVLEAMAAGAATVAFDCPYGPGAIIRNGETGILVPPQNTEALAKAILTFLKNPSHRENLARAGLSVREEFAMSKILKQWKALL